MIFVPQLIFLLVLLAGVIALQIFLSRKQTRWYGLVLPALTCLLSFITVFSLLAYSGKTIVWVSNEKGEVISQEEAVNQTSVGEWLGQALPILLVQNLPTIGLLVIYVVCREKLKKKEELKKMNIQDLE